jgi:hypothetical protein
MVLTTASDLTLRPARITKDKFISILRAHGSPALAEAGPIWDLLINGGVDPSFALGQYHVESLMGKSGYARTTKSWGNMLWDAAWTGDQPKYHPSGSAYTYALYDSWTEGVADYVEYVRRYAVTLDYATHAVSDTIWTETSRWTGHPAGDVGHEQYVQIILSLINDEFEFVPGAFIEVGDKMIDVDLSAITTTKKYPVKNGTYLYRGTTGDVLKIASFGTKLPDGSAGGMCQFLGPVGNRWADTKWAWGAIVVGVSTLGGAKTVVYIKDPVKASVV